MSQPANIALQVFKSQRPTDPAAAKRRERRTYLKLKAEFLMANPICQICRFAKSTSLHHRFGRGGELLLWKPGFVAACEKCHSTVHCKVGWAIANGWIGI